ELHSQAGRARRRRHAGRLGQPDDGRRPGVRTRCRRGRGTRGHLHRPLGAGGARRRRQARLRQRARGSQQRLGGVRLLGGRAGRGAAYGHVRRPRGRARADRACARRGGGGGGDRPGLPDQQAVSRGGDPRRDAPAADRAARRRAGDARHRAQSGRHRRAVHRAGGHAGTAGHQLLRGPHRLARPRAGGGQQGVRARGDLRTPRGRSRRGARDRRRQQRHRHAVLGRSRRGHGAGSALGGTGCQRPDRLGVRRRRRHRARSLVL
ncbi:MAG: HAD-superfamily hydrolase, subfamily IIB, partial [uncultured Nocardioidaceae bacterium]